MAMLPGGAGAPIPTVPGAQPPAGGTSGNPWLPVQDQGPVFPAIPSEVRRMNKLWGFENGRLPYATRNLREFFENQDTYRSETMGALQGLPGTPYVYTGGKHYKKSFKTMDALMGEFESMSNDTKRGLAKKLAMAGYLGGSGSLAERVEEATLMDVASAYEQLLGEAAARFAQGQDMSPEDIMEMNIRYNIGSMAEGEWSDETASKWWDKLNEPAKPKTVTTEQVSRDIYSPEDARTLAKATLQQTLGRDPSGEEFEDFVAALQTAQQNNPTITETRSRYNAEGEMTRQSTTSTGGIDPSTVANEFAESRPDWAEWQAVGTYFPALMQMLGAGVPNA